MKPELLAFVSALLLPARAAYYQHRISVMTGTIEILRAEAARANANMSAGWERATELDAENKRLTLALEEVARGYADLLKSHGLRQQ